MSPENVVRCLRGRSPSETVEELVVTAEDEDESD